MLDSLVRVTRRDDNCHLINILAHDLGGPARLTPDTSPKHCSCPQSFSATEMPPSALPRISARGALLSFLTRERQTGSPGPLPMLLTQPEGPAHRPTSQSLFLYSQVMLIGLLP